MAGGEGGPTFENTPSWVIGAVVFVIVAISLVVEKLLHYLGKRLKQKNRKPLYDALQKIKEELMLMGFISLLLAVIQDEVMRWCIPEKLASKWLPCTKGGHVTKEETNATAHFQTSFDPILRRHLLAAENGNRVCAEGKVPFISLEVLHQLHYFIFILAVAHVVNCTLTAVLGELKINFWRKWEEAIRLKHQEDGNQSDRVIDIRSLTFIQQRFTSVDAHKRNYIISFFKHLCGIVTKADYEALRFGFVLTHCNGNQMFDFHKYMVYAYEADLEKVVSINWFLWLIAVIALTLNVAGWHIYLIVSLITVVLLLIVGTKLEQVITELATYIAQRNTVVVGNITLQPSDEYFWFNRPRIVLFFVHAIIFLNSFGFANFFWALFQFKFHSCIMGETSHGFVYGRLLTLILCLAISSYSTLPLYAIVTQMGSSYHAEAMERSGGSTLGGNHDASDRTNGAASIEMANQ